MDIYDFLKQTSYITVNTELIKTIGDSEAILFSYIISKITNLSNDDWLYFSVSLFLILKKN